MLDVLIDALNDTVKVLPFLLVVFIIISVLEHHVSKEKYARVLGGKFATPIGAAAGVIPQCGFSVMAAKLYQERCITVGTLMAIFISASDEGVVLLITGGKWKELLILTAIKLVTAISAGYIIDAIIRKSTDAESAVSVEEYGCCHHGGEGESNLHKYFIHPLLHCLKTAGYVLIVNIVLGTIIYLVGESNFEKFMAGTGYFQPFVAALIGLIPNCAPSVVISETYLAGNLCFGGLVAGLISNAGVGVALLFKSKKGLLKNLALLFTLYFIGVAVGEAVMLVSLL